MNSKAAGPGQIHIVTVQRDLDLATADSLYVRAQAVISRHPRLLLLDLTAVPFYDAGADREHGQARLAQAAECPCRRVAFATRVHAQAAGVLAADHQGVARGADLGAEEL